MIGPEWLPRASNEIDFLQRELDVRTNQLASQRIAFEEEQLTHEGADRRVADGEAEALGIKLKNQVKLEQN